MSAGASQSLACQEIGISQRTLQRWSKDPGKEDQRQGPKTRPANSLSEEEKANIVAIATSQEFQDKSPHQIVPTLADRGEYIASESSFYRVLKANAMLYQTHLSLRKFVEYLS